MTKHLNAIALALLHLPFQSRAFNSITRAGISVRHLTQSRLCCDQELRFNGGKINGKSASFRRLTLKDTFFNRNRFSHPLRPNVKSFSTKMTAHDVFNAQQDWQDLKRSIQTIEPKYRSFFFSKLLQPRFGALNYTINRAFQSSFDQVFLLDKIKECEGLSAGTLAGAEDFFPRR